jgi:glycosyltransferase involved in cell wall biosynthesis
MAAIYAESDFQLVPLRNLRIFRGTVPSKLQNSLARGVPVITSVAGDVSRIVEAHSLGLTAAPEDPESLADAIRRAYFLSGAERAELARNARRFYTEQMSLDRGVDAFDNILQQAAKAKEGMR